MKIETTLENVTRAVLACIQEELLKEQREIPELAGRGFSARGLYLITWMVGDPLALLL